MSSLNEFEKRKISPGDSDQSHSTVDDALQPSIYLYHRERLKYNIKRHLLNAEIILLAAESIDFLDVDGYAYDTPIEKKALKYLLEPDRTSEIIRRLKAEDSDVYYYLYEFELPKIVRFITMNSGTNEIAKDLFQEALVVLLEKVHRQTLDIKYSFSTYLYSITRNLWIGHLKREKKYTAIVDDYKQFEDVEIDSEKESLPADYESISKAIELLGESCKRLLEYYYFKQMDWNEIATLLGYSSAGSARNQKFKCLERIRDSLKTG